MVSPTPGLTAGLVALGPARSHQGTGRPFPPTLARLHDPTSQPQGPCGRGAGYTNPLTWGQGTQLALHGLMTERKRLRPALERTSKLRFQERKMQTPRSAILLNTRPAGAVGRRSHCWRGQAGTRHKVCPGPGLARQDATHRTDQAEQRVRWPGRWRDEGFFLPRSTGNSGVLVLWSAVGGADLGILDRKPCHSQSGLHVGQACSPKKRPRVSSTGRPLSNGPCCAHPGIVRLYE